MFKLCQSKNQFIFCSLDADDDAKNSSQHIVAIIISIQIIVSYTCLWTSLNFQIWRINVDKTWQWQCEHTVISELPWILKKQNLAIFCKYYSPLELKLRLITIMFTGIKTKWSNCRVISNVTGRAQLPCVCVSIPNNSQFNEFNMWNRPCWWWCTYILV